MPLDELRRQIDEIDDQLVELLSRRARVVQQVGQLKRREGSQVYAPGREQLIYRRLGQLNPGPLPDESLRGVFCEIISACRALERQLVVCYLGPPGSFSEEAARRHFGSAVEYRPVPDIPDVFNEVSARRAYYGVAPVENTTVGGIADTLDRFAETNVNICAEILLAVHHCLMACCPIEQVERVYSKPQALSQCQQWLRRNLPDAQQCEADSTSQAAQLARTERHAAAIAHHSAAALYGLDVLSTAIEDNPENATKFLVLGHGFPESTGHDRTSLMVSLKHEVGSLYSALLPFKKHCINLSKIESRPNRQRKWEYYFFIDIEGHCKDEHVRLALEELQPACTSLHVLGSYPIAEQQG